MQNVSRPTVGERGGYCYEAATGSSESGETGSGNVCQAGDGRLYAVSQRRETGGHFRGRRSPTSGLVEHVVRRGYNRTLAEDAAQEAYIAFQAAPPEVRADPIRAMAWLRSVAVYIARRLAKKDARYISFDATDGEPVPTALSIGVADTWRTGGAEIFPGASSDASERDLSSVGLHSAAMHVLVKELPPHYFDVLVNASEKSDERESRRRRPKGQGPTSAHRQLLRRARAFARRALARHGITSPDKLG